MIIKNQVALLLCTTLLLGACSKNDDVVITYPDPSVPENGPGNNNNNNGNENNTDPYAYLSEYKPLKECLDRTAHPTFKVSAALDVADFNSKGQLYNLAKENFDEVVAGNAMKMASCVWDNGGMNFTRVQDFVKSTEEAGISIYGHTLLWHSQQPVNWLGSLISGKVQSTGSGEMKVIYNYDFSDDSQMINGWGDNSSRSIADGALVLKNTAEGNSWSSQAAIDGDLIPQDTKMTLKIKAKASQDYSFSIGFQNPSPDEGYPSCGNFPALSLTTEYQEFEVSTVISGPKATRFLVNFGDIVGSVYIDQMTLSAESIEKIPLTKQETVDTLVWAMKSWMNGMMNATQGKVKAWDLINEAVSGGGNVNGYYELQNAKQQNSGSWDVGGSNFFWQDYLGAENYGVIAERVAREAYAAVEGTDPNDLKLFINDYNLESTWDNNKKLESLIYWIGVWEKGGAQIDGIGTQMHINYYRNKNDQENQKKAITRMFELMAKTGKLCRVSELDMGVADTHQESFSGKKYTTSQMNFELEKEMADYYQWIIEEYFRVIPVEQQYGICQWTITDSPANSGWRANEPVGLFYLNSYDRKPAYGGWAEGLSK